MNRRPRRQYRLLGLLITIATLCILASPEPRAGTVTVFGPTKLTRTTGSPDVFNFTFVTGAAVKPYVLHIDNHGVTSAVVTLNGVQILGPNDFKSSGRDDWKKSSDWDDDDWYRDDNARRGRDDKDHRYRDDDWRGDCDWKSVIERTVTLLATGNNTLRIELRSKPGTHLSVRISGSDAVTDTTPPTIKATASPAPNSAGWNRTDVQVAFACSDSGSGIASCPATQVVSSEGQGQVVTGTATDKAGNTASATLTLNIDRTAPSIVASISPAANAAGWVKQTATVTFVCTDDRSGIASCPSPKTVSTAGANQIVQGTATDRAGNTKSASVTVSIDKVKPTITALVTPAPKADGTIDGDATVTFTCADAGSGIDSCTLPIVVTAAGTQTVTGTAVDRAGNNATASVTVKIVKTGPSISATVAPAPNAAGWHRTDAVVSFTCSGGSGAVTCPAPVTVTTEGANQVVTRSVTDSAGHSSQASVTLNIDKSAPAIAGTPSPAANAAGWHRGAVTVTFACTDALSGVAACQTPATVSSQGAAQQIMGTVTDRAGNTATAAVTLNIDTAPPTISAAVTPAPGASGTIDTDATVTFTCADTGSGIASCPPPIVVTAEGSQTFSGTAVDRAGNEATASASVNIVKTRASITATVAPDANANGWHRTDVVVTFVCSAGGFGPITCPAPVTVATEGANQIVTRSITDSAGRTLDASVTLNIDKSAPVIAASAAPAANAAGWHRGEVAVSFSCSDVVSGVLACQPPVTLSSQGAAQEISGTVTDRAGNTATGAVTLNIDTTPPTISAQVSPAPNADGSVDSNATITFTCADAGSGIASCPAPIAVTAEGPQTFTGTAVDRAGNEAAASATVNVVKTHVSISATVAPPANANGWHRTDVVVTFTCSSDGSAPVSCPAPVTVTAEGANQVVTRSATDSAGRTSQASVTLNIDKSAPTIAGTASPVANSAGWHRGAVTVSFACSDQLSGVLACQPPSAVSTQGAAQQITGTVTDRAGNTATSSVALNIDTTPPTVTITTPAAGSTLTTSPAALSGSASDALSGVASATCNGTAVPALALSCAPTLAAGDNTLTLTATDVAGNVATAQVSVTLTLANRSPVATAGGTYSGVAGAPIFFSAAGSSDPDDDAITLSWDFGDGAHGTGMAPSHTYATPNTYVVTLTITDARNASSTATASAVIAAANLRPTVTAGGPYAAAVGAPVAFAASATDGDGDPLSYQWNFGDGTAGIGAAIAHVYQNAGTYAVVVTVSDGRGGSATASAQAVVTMPNRPPTVSIGGPYAGVNGAPVAFSATGTDPDGDPIGYTWDFGDGGSGTGASATHMFGSTGSYVVRVTANDNRGGASSASATVAIAQANRAPHAAIGGPYSGEARTRIAFNASASADPDQDTLSYAWEFGDGATATGASPNHGYASAGSFTAKVAVDDGRGGRDVATAVVTVVPAAATVNQPPVARSGGPYSGEAARVLALNASASTDPDGDVLTFAWDFGDGSQGSGPAPVHQYATNGTFTITLTVDDGHGHTHTATTSATIAVAADRAPPSVVVSAPSRVLPGAEVLVTAVAADNVAVASVTFEVDGGPPAILTAAPYQRLVAVPAVSAPGATIRIRVTAVDGAGNAGVANAAIAIDAAPDTQKPTVALNAPAKATPGSQIHVTATADDNVGVVSVAFSAASAPIATVPAAPYAATYTVPADAAVGSVLTFTARATDFTGNDATAIADVAIVQSSDTTPPAVAITAPVSIAPGAMLNITADVTDLGGVSSVAFYVDDVRIATAAQAPYSAAFAVPPATTPGSVLRVEARALDFAGLEGRAETNTIVVAGGKAFAIGEVFDDATGRLLEGAAIALVGTDAFGLPYTETAVSDARGRFLIRAASGHGVLTVRQAGMTGVDRPVDLQNGAAIEVLDSRLTPAGTPVTVSGVLGGMATTDVATLVVPAGAAPDALELALTGVSQQGLQGSLPPGWSPVSVVDIAPHGVALAGATLAVPNTWHFTAGAQLVLARWEETAAAWRALGAASVAADERTIRGSIDGTGAFAVLVADVLPSAPANPNAGDLLTGVALGAIPADALSLVNPTPKVLFYSPGVKSAVAASLTSAAPLPSGTVVWSRMTESYHFVAGSEIHPEPYTADLVFYQRATSPTLQSAGYAVSPSLTFEPLTLKDGVISVELFARPEIAAPITSIGPGGGVLTAPTGESIQVPPGAATDVTPLQIAGIAAGELGVPLPAGFDLLGAMRVSFTGALAQPAVVSVPSPASLGDTTGMLLVRLQELEGWTRLVLVGTAHLAGDRIVSDLTLDGAPQTFEGVRVAGRYAFVHTSALLGFAAGTAAGIDGAPFTGALVSTPSLAIVALSRGAAGYIAVGAVGTSVFTARDLVRADAGSGSLTFRHHNDVLALDLQLAALPPRVTTIAPAGGSTNVSLGTAVVITFSEAIDPASVSGSQVANIVLAGADGTVVPATLVLSSNNSVATLRPTATLAENTAYTAIVSAGVTDLSGYQIGAPFSATFTTLDTVPPLPPAAGSISAGIPANGSSTIRATQGTAGAHDLVSIINVTTGQISPVLLDSNGGFQTTVGAALTDKLRLKIVDAAGNATTIELPRFSQTNADGSVSTAIGPDGGLVTGASGEIVDVQAGTFPSGAVITVKLLTEAAFPLQLTERDRRTFSFTAGVRLDFGGATPQKYLNVGIPVQGGETVDDQWVVAQVVDNVVGATRFSVVDTARVIDGRIRTSSPPCPGVTAAGTYGFLRPGRPVGVLFGPLDRGLPAAVFAPFLVPGMISLDPGDSIWGAYDSINGIVDSISPYVANAQDIVAAFSRYTCIPTLSGAVTVGANRVVIGLPAGVLTDADLEVAVTNVTRGAKVTRAFQPFGTSVNVEGSTADTYTAEAINFRGEHRALAITVRPQSFVAVKVSGLGATDSRVVVHNETRQLTASVQYNPQSFAPSVSLLLEGVVGDVYSAEIAGSAPRTLVPAVSAYPIGTGNLIARAIFGAIDPTRAQIDAINALRPPDYQIPAKGVELVGLQNLTNSTNSVILDTASGNIAGIVDGAFAFAFDGSLNDTYEVQVHYEQGGFESVKVPNFHVSVTDPRSGNVIRRVSGQTPPRGEPVQIDLGPPGAGPAAPSYTSAALTRVDPSLPIVLQFSQALDAATVAASMAVYDDAGKRVAGQWVLSSDGFTAVFNADSALKLDAKYHIALAGVKDKSGRPLAAVSLPFTTFKPIRLGRVVLNNEPPFAISVKDLGFVRQPATPKDRTTVVAVSGNQLGNKLHTIDVTDPLTPHEVGHTAGGSYKRRVTLLSTNFTDISYEVPLVPQQTGMSCWAAGAAMIVGWKDQVSIDPSDIAGALGYWHQYQAGLPGYDKDMFREWHLVPEPQQSYSVAKFRDMLEQYGPLWVASRVPGVHIRVITGMTGDGTPDGTLLSFNDPWEENMTAFNRSNVGSQYTRTFSQFVTEQEALVQIWSGVQTIPFLTDACTNHDADACAVLADPVKFALLTRCAAGDDAACAEVTVPGSRGTYIAHLAAKPSWVPPPETGPITVGSPIDPGCAAHITASTFVGDMAVASSWNIDDTYLTFFDVTDATKPCVVGGKLLTANPERLNAFTQPGTFHVSGFARGVTTMHHATGFAAYVAESEAGIFGADVGKNVPEPTPEKRVQEGAYSGDMMDVVALRDRLLALNNNFGGDASLDVLTPDLTPVASVALGTFGSLNNGSASKVHRLVTARGVRIDRDHDGSIGSDEIFDLAFVGGSGGVTVVDVSDLDNPQLAGRIALPGIIRELDVDKNGRLLLAGGDRTAATNGDEAIFFINLANPFAAPAIDAATGLDTRVSYTVAYPGGVAGFKIDTVKGRIYVGWPGVAPDSGGVDVWAFARRGTQNHPPTAVAGPDQTVDAKSTVHLSGSQSTDPDGDVLSFEWVQTSGRAVTLIGATSMTPSFIAPDIDGEVLTFSLVVRDDYTASQPSTVKITVRKGSLVLTPALLVAAVMPANRQLKLTFDAHDGNPPRIVTADPDTKYSWIGGSSASPLPDLTPIVNKLAQKLGFPIPVAGITVSNTGQVAIGSAGIQVIRAQYKGFDSGYAIVLAGLTLKEISLAPFSGLSILVSEVMQALGTDKNPPMLLVTDNNGYVLDKGTVVLQDVVFQYLGGPTIGLQDLASALEPITDGALTAALTPISGPAAPLLADAMTKLLGIVGAQLLTDVASSDAQVATVDPTTVVVSGLHPGVTSIGGTLDLGDFGKASDNVFTFVLPSLESVKVEPNVTTIMLGDTSDKAKIRSFAETTVVTSAVFPLTGKAKSAAALVDSYLPVAGYADWTAGIDRYFPANPAPGQQKVHLRGKLTVDLSQCAQNGDDVNCAVRFSDLALGFYVPNILTNLAPALRPIVNDYQILPDPQRSTPVASVGTIERFDTHLKPGLSTGVSPITNTVSAWLAGSVVDTTATVRVIDAQPKVEKTLVGWDVLTRVATYRVRVTNVLAERIHDVVILDQTFAQADAECHAGVLIDTQQLTIAALEAGQSADLVVNVAIPLSAGRVAEAAIVDTFYKESSQTRITVQRTTWTRSDAWLVCEGWPPTALLRSPMINEVVVEPQRDWNDSGAGGNAAPFDDLPGSGAAGSAAVTIADQWIEFLTNTGTAEELRNWTLDFTDTLGVPQSITIVPSMLKSKAGSPYVVLGAPGSIDPMSVLVLRDPTHRAVDSVNLGLIHAALGPATGVADEAIGRTPDGVQTNQPGDFARRAASIGKLNP